MFRDIVDIRTRRIAICDDDEVFRQQCRQKCEAFFKKQKQLVEIMEFSRADELVKCDKQFYIIFLDIEMPGLSGIQVKDMLAKAQPNAAIIYITSYSSYMPQAFGKNVYSFLEKPLKFTKFKNAVKQVIRDLTIQGEYLIINDKKVLLSQIIYIKGADKYVRFMIYGKDSEVVRGTMNEWQEKLEDKGFFRTHKSYIVNFQWVYSTEHVLTLKNKEIIPVSRNLRKRVKEEYYAFLDDVAF